MGGGEQEKAGRHLLKGERLHSKNEYISNQINTSCDKEH